MRSRRDGKMVLYSLTDGGRELLSTVLELASERAERVQPGR